MTGRERRAHLTLIRSFHLADFLTLGNAACGVLAVFAIMRYVETRAPRGLLAAIALIPLALVLDVLDGRVARWRMRHSALGASSTRWPTSSRSAWRPRPSPSAPA